MTKALLCAALLAAPLHTTEDWQSFAPANAGFSAMFPGRPQQSALYTPTLAGLLNTMTASVNDSLRNSFMVSWTTYAKANADAERSARSLERAAQELVRSRGGKLVSDEAIQIGAIRGQQATFTLDDGRTVQVRFFLSGARFFQVMTETKGEAARALAERFFSAFELKG